jgi:hypothetical protein
MTDEFVNSVTDRYVELYELITGEPFRPHQAAARPETTLADMKKRIEEALEEL